MKAFWFAVTVILAGVGCWGQDGPRFEVATLKRAAPGAEASSGSWSPPGGGRFTATHVPVVRLLQLAYDVDASQITNAPGWMETELYDVEAKAEDGVGLSRKELEPRLQLLLRERLGLRAHEEMRKVRGYGLVVGKGGARLQPTKGDHFPGFRVNVSAGNLRGFNWSMAVLAKYLTAAAGFPVVDETGIAGSYDFDLRYGTEEGSDEDGLAEALRKATGLVLKAEEVAGRVVVVDGGVRVPVGA